MNIPKLNLKSIESSNINTSISTKRQNTNRILMKTYLNKQILQQCLENFDIFKQINQDPLLKRKLINDVLKLIIMKVYDSQGIIFNKGQNSQSMYMVIKGSVSLCLPIYINNNKGQQDDNAHYQYKQINMYSKGDGFGQSEFIVGKKRSLMAMAKENNTVIGMIQCSAFQQIIQNFRNRDYLKKMNMFSQCPFLKNLQKYALQFIVNNSKPIIFPLYKQIAAQNQHAKALYLITSGHVQLKKTCSQQNTSNNKLFSHYNTSKNKMNSLQIGILQAGQFLGDNQLALKIPYGYTAIVKSQKVRAYVCDQRIIMSQMNEQAFNQARIYYQHRYNYHKNKQKIYRNVRSKLKKQAQKEVKQIMNKVQIQLKRRITKRYVQQVPSLIGKLSPRQIQLIVNKKYQKLKTQPFLVSNSAFSQLSIQIKKKKLKANQKSYSPYLKKIQQFKHTIQKEQQQKQLSEQKSLKKDFLTNISSNLYINSPSPSQNYNSQQRVLFPVLNPLRNKPIKGNYKYKQYIRSRMKSQTDDIQKSQILQSIDDEQTKRIKQFKANIMKYKHKSILFYQNKQ